ncbi:hypothetical protein CYMTET_27366 [Cymbomonas tetramitiformis]|uniref:Uncharacterized protein n=1 Tax=Cymbomonas tetramitiformis TaxID=36881 RepID=A0AAE0FQ91_9CHLO|nr:hypothetical protein CYMTET_27366 [Cymbomonas tetramitiformis]
MSQQRDIGCYICTLKELTRFACANSTAKDIWLEKRRLSQMKNTSLAKFGFKRNVEPEAVNPVPAVIRPTVRTGFGNNEERWECSMCGMVQHMWNARRKFEGRPPTKAIKDDFSSEDGDTSDGADDEDITFTIQDFGNTDARELFVVKASHSDEFTFQFKIATD